MKPELDSRTVIFLTEHAAMGVDSVRFVMRLADNMSAVGYRTGMLNLGEPFPRPYWFVPPLIEVEPGRTVHTVLDRTPGRVHVPTTWRTAYLAADYVLAEGDTGVAYVEDVGVPRAEDPAAARLMVRGYRLLPGMTPSPWTAATLAHVGVEDMTVLPLALDAPMLAPVSARHGSGVVAFYSDPHRPADDTVAVEAFRIAAASNDGLTLRAFGYGPKAAPLRGQGDHTMLTWQDDDGIPRAAEYDRAECFLWTRSHDPLGIRVLEAMSRGCAVVAVRSEGLQPFCVDEENCLLTDVGDTKALGDAILRVTGDEGLRRRLSAAGRATAEGRAWEALLDALPAAIRAEQRPERARGLEAIRWE